MPLPHDPLAPAIDTAHQWLRAVTEDLGTYDRNFAHRALRAWLHTVRDSVGAGTAAQLAAQLPELFRGTFYEGWVPDEVPHPHTVESFLAQFAAEAGVSDDEAAALLGAVTEAVSRLFSTGQLGRLLAEVPAPLRRLLTAELLSSTFAAGTDNQGSR
ncbi:DUF2267 domain-containing protein [Nocardia flavorosea]|uniref:DUF2267 domain-containing protein n=1 Tax=Nocardia flavorosea TaxID=53429 RepID=A0A846YKJ9_9NOCA|nr:DUF2267 domain-containing protein [Nocardia flavorosea]NKY59373.1 DUF2267 domain-containing protein [Nocardia flavorosea]